MSPHEDGLGAPAGDALYEDAPCGLLLARSDGLIVRANRTFCRWAGHAADDLVGRRRFQDLLTMGGKIFHQTHFVPLLQMQGSVSEVKLDLVCGDGSIVPVVVNAVRRGASGTQYDEIAVFVAKDRHVYERELMLARKRAEELAARQKEVQDELRRADRRKDEFLAMLAHELRNPLAPISTAAERLRMGDVDAAQLHRIGEIIARQAGHLANLVDDLLDVSRVTRGLIQLEVETVDLADVVDAAVEQSRPLVESRRHALRVDAPRGMLVDGDRTRLVQIVANLLHNAAKYTPQGGAVDVVVERVDGRAAIHVRDTGMGIDAALLPHLFDLFSQGERTPDRSQGGLGIGLALVRSLAELHGGAVAMHSDGPHSGSRFSVYLPVVEGRVAAAPPAPAVPVAAGPAALRVLIVDDNADAAAMLAELLAMLGHAPVVAHTGGDALARLAHAPVDVYILDIGLPDMTGYELAARIRERAGPDGLLIALTGYGQPHDRVLSKAACFEHHLVKPLDVAALVEILAGVAPRHPARLPA